MIGRYTTGLRRVGPPHTELNGPADLNLPVPVTGPVDDRPVISPPYRTDLPA